MTVDIDGNLLVTTQDSKKIYVYAPERRSEQATWRFWKQFALKDYSYGIAVHSSLGVFTCGYNEARVDQLGNFEVNRAGSTL